jgi:hypothetical protein
LENTAKVHVDKHTLNLTVETAISQNGEDAEEAINGSSKLWKCLKLAIVTKGSTEAELVALTITCCATSKSIE